MVVDSRLIAEELDITHKSLMETIRGYQSTIESTFGKLRFETEVNGANPARFVYLTEDQAAFVATLSRNSEQVVAFKADKIIP